MNECKPHKIVAIKKLLLHSFFWVIPQHLNFMGLHFGTLCPIFIGGVSRKYNQDEIVEVFIWEKVWLKNGLSQSEGGGPGGGVSE